MNYWSPEVLIEAWDTLVPKAAGAFFDFVSVVGRLLPFVDFGLNCLKELCKTFRSTSDEVFTEACFSSCLLIC